ncbi:MAG: nucleotidyl transferase AbiEii/AbiGii toxin family protein [Candidatus Micrarchaeota archaeon]
MIDERIFLATGLSKTVVLKELKLSELLSHANAVFSAAGRKHAVFGGTAINKAYLDNPRFSEDVDMHLFGASERQARDLLEKLPGVRVEAPQRLFKEFLRFPIRYSFEEEGVDDVINFDVALGLKAPKSTVVWMEARSFLAKHGVLVPSALIPTYEVETLIAMKLLAAASRAEGKDLYDLNALLAEKNFDAGKVFTELYRYSDALFDFQRVDAFFFEKIMDGVRNASVNELRRFDAFIPVENRVDWSALKNQLLFSLETKLAKKFK